MPFSNTTSAAASEDADLAALFERLALAAGKAIMEVYDGAFAVDLKDDQSPVTAADRAGEAIILAGLRAARPDLLCVAEEECASGIEPETLGASFFLIDPLDGTREFVSKRPDFTVNIALIRSEAPAVGVVYAPARGEMHSCTPGRAEAIEVDADFRIGKRREIRVRTGSTPLTIVASRSHRTDETNLYIRDFAAAEIVSVGSSLKFCMIAEGKADLYPRFGKTMEWDTAAGDAILRAAGGMTTTLDGAPLTYGKRRRRGLADFTNPDFVARGVIAPD